MAIDFGTGLRALQTFGEEASRDQAMRLNDQRAQQQSYAFNQGVRQDQARPGLIAQARGGNYQGAQDAALGGGDFDLAKVIGGLRDDQLAEFQHQADVVGNLVPKLKTLPPEQRAHVGASVLAQAGFTPQQLQSMDWSDEGLDTQYQLSAAGKAALAARVKASEPYTLSPGAKRMSGDQLIADNPAMEKPIWDAESGSLIYPSQFAPGGGAQPGYAAPPQSQPSPSGGGFHIAGLPGERVTSTYRTPAHNAEVGGVGNSYHTRRDAQGNPLARDSVPPAGMSMSAYAARLRAENPGKDVINEGDHVHIEPSGRGSGSAAPVDRPGVVNVRAPRQKQGNAPSGYRFNGDGLEPIPGGPADPKTATSRNVQSNRKAEADFRKEFDGLPEVKTFKTARSQFQALRSLALNPNATAQDDIATIFSFMKTLDSTSTVREGEFATAQNSGGVADTIRNAYNKALNGERLNPQQRRNMVRSAYQSYKAYRDAYNTTADNYRGYARDTGINPDRVARTYTPDKPAAKPSGKFTGLKITRVQ